MDYLNNEVLTATQADAAIAKAHSIGSSASEIDGIVKISKKDFSSIQPSTARTSMVAYTSSGNLQLTAKLDLNNDIYYVISKNGVNNVTSLYNIKTKTNTEVDSLPPSSGGYTNTQTASTDTVCAPYKVKAINNGDSGISNFTGGWHGQNGDLSGLPTAQFVGYTFVVDGVDRTSENNIIRTGVKKVEYTVTHNIMGYNTFTTNRYILQEKMKYTIIEGIIQFDMEITALEDCTIELYYGLQTQANSTAWNQTILFKNGEYGRLNFTSNINSGNKYSGVSTLTSQRGTTDELETWIDNSYGLGQRKQVSDLTPSVFSIFSTMKTYQNLVNGIPLTLLTGEKAYWRGGWRIRRIDTNRI